MTWGAWDDLSIQIRSCRGAYIRAGDHDERRFVSADPRFPLSVILPNWRSSFYDFNREAHLQIDASPIWIVRRDLPLVADRDRTAAAILADPARFAELDAKAEGCRLMHDTAPLGATGSAPRYRWRGPAGESERVLVLDRRMGLWDFARTPVNAVSDPVWNEMLRSVRWLSDEFFADVAAGIRSLAASDARAS